MTHYNSFTWSIIRKPLKTWSAFLSFLLDLPHKKEFIELSKRRSYSLGSMVLRHRWIGNLRIIHSRRLVSRTLIFRAIGKEYSSRTSHKEKQGSVFSVHTLLPFGNSSDSFVMFWYVGKCFNVYSECVYNIRAWLHQRGQEGIISYFPPQQQFEQSNRW